MSIYHDPRPLRTLPLYTASAEDAARLFPHQRRVPQRRAEYVRAQLARDRDARRENLADNLDPVLRAHLGLEQKQRAKARSALWSKRSRLSRFAAFS